jgi:hypothetical protein
MQPTSIGGPTSSTSNVHLTAGGVVYNGGQTINSLNMDSPTAAASALTFGNATDVLTIASGGIISGDDNAARSIGTAALPGVITTAGPELFIHQGANILTVNSVIGGGGNTAFNLVMDGMSQPNSPQIILANANAYVGTTYVSGVTVDLSNTTGSGRAITGNLVINGGNNNARRARHHQFPGAQLCQQPDR